MPTRFNNSDSQFNKLPSNYLEKLKANKTPILLISGADNKVFTDSNYYTYRKLSNINPTLYKFHTFKLWLPRYIHGKKCSFGCISRFQRIFKFHLKIYEK